MTNYARSEATVMVQYIPIRVQFDFDPADPSVGMADSIEVRYIFIGEHEVTDMLTDYVMDEIYEKLFEERARISQEMTALESARFKRIDL